jgi:hypothetical protein
MKPQFSAEVTQGRRHLGPPRPASIKASRKGPESLGRRGSCEQRPAGSASCSEVDRGPKFRHEASRAVRARTFEDPMDEG